MMKKIWVLSLFLSLILMVPPLLALPTTININSADAAALASQLKGIGLKKATAMIEYRKKNGPFSEIEDIVLVKGIGWKTMEANRDKIRLRDKEPVQASKLGSDAISEKSQLGEAVSGVLAKHMKPTNH